MQRFGCQNDSRLPNEQPPPALFFLRPGHRIIVQSRRDRSCRDVSLWDEDMRFFKRLFIGIDRELAAILRVVGLLRWQAWTAWAGLFALSLAGTLPMDLML